MHLKQKTISFLDSNTVRTVIFTIMYKKWNLFHNNKLNLSSFKFCKAFSTYIKIVYFSEMLNLKISCLIYMEELKSLTLDFPNLILKKMKLLIHIVEVLNTWHPKCSLSKNSILFRSGHSYQVDYYALGILLYELLFGRSPFYAPKKEDIFFAILNS